MHYSLVRNIISQKSNCRSKILIKLKWYWRKIIFEENNRRIKASWTFSIINYVFLFHQRETLLWKRGSMTEVNKFDLQVVWEEVIFKDYQNGKNKK